MIHVHATPDAAAAAVAARVAAEGAGAIAARGEFRWALSGGRTPVPLYRLLATPEWREQLDWPRVRLLFADERAVPPDDAESNYDLLRTLLIRPLGLADEQVRRIEGEASDLDAAARAYERELESPLDAVLLGMGSDGHVASLFPGHPATGELSRRVVALTDSPKPPPRRLTVTPRTLREARVAIVLCTGDEKAPAALRALREKPPARECPATIVADGEWFLDGAAAALL